MRHKNDASDAVDVSRELATVDAHDCFEELVRESQVALSAQQPLSELTVLSIGSESEASKQDSDCEFHFSSSSDLTELCQNRK